MSIEFNPNLYHAVRELYYWQHSNDQKTWFHAKLYDLIHKADSENFLKLSMGFQEEIAAYNLWLSATEYGDELFRVYGLLENNK